MNADQSNPNVATETIALGILLQGNIDRLTHKKIHAILKDADQFWKVFFICIFCTGLGSIIVGPWYLVRLMQWNSVAQAQPSLLDPNLPRGSLAQRFQSARGMLIAGLICGVVFFLASLLVLVALLVTIATVPQRV